MSPRPYEVFLIRATFGFSTDPRPCVILEEPQANLVKVALISSALDLHKPHLDFLIEESDWDFPATGLKRTSFVSGATFDEHSVSDLIKWLGRLEGSLKTRFVEWFG